MSRSLFVPSAAPAASGPLLSGRRGRASPTASSSSDFEGALLGPGSAKAFSATGSLPNSAGSNSDSMDSLPQLRVTWARRSPATTQPSGNNVMNLEVDDGHGSAI